MSIAAAMRPYLQPFQSDGPLLPFITSELEILLWTLMGKFMKRAVLEGANRDESTSSVWIQKRMLVYVSNNSSQDSRKESS